MMTRYNKQSGVALIIGLIVLLMLTIIMITAIQVSILEERMAVNMRNQNIAFQSAESALRDAEAWLLSGATEVNPIKLSSGPFQNEGEVPCVNGLCGTTDPLQSASIKTISSDQIRVTTTGMGTIYAEPQWMIELIRIAPSPDSGRLYATFRITARAWGFDATSQVQLQSTYRLHALSFIY